MKITALIVVLLVAAVGPHPRALQRPVQNGASPDYEQQAWGAGLFTCGKWTQDDDPMLRGLQEQWVMGWISAVDYQMSAMRRLKTEFPGLAVFTFPKLAQTDGDAVHGYIDKYCRDHPLDLVRDAAKALASELQKRGGGL